MKKMHLVILSKGLDTIFWPDGGDNQVRIVCVCGQGRKEVRELRTGFVRPLLSPPLPPPPPCAEASQVIVMLVTPHHQTRCFRARQRGGHVGQVP